MRPQYPLDRRAVVEPAASDTPTTQVAASTTATAARLPATPVPGALVLRVYTRVGGRLDSTCLLAD